MNKVVYDLTPREFEIIGEICEGASNADIGKKLSISEETVKRHLSNIFNKTGCGTRLELGIFAIAKGLVILNAEGCTGPPQVDHKTLVEYLAGIQQQLAAIQNLLSINLGVPQT